MDARTRALIPPRWQSTSLRRPQHPSGPSTTADISMTRSKITSTPRNVFFLYSRKSTEAEDRQILSIDSQIDDVKRLAEKLGLTIGEIFTEARSAKAPGRPVFNDMMRRIAAGEGAGILCWKLDRLARNPMDGGSLIWAVRQHRIRILTPA